MIQKKLSENQINRNKSLEGKILNVLVENKMKDGVKLFGRTEYMTSVIFDGNSDYIGKIVPIEITSSNQNSLFGKIKENFKKKVAWNLNNVVSKKINSNLKFVYSDNNSLSVIFQDNDLLMGVVGEFNENLKELEKITDTNLYSRGNSILIKSTPKKMKLQKMLFNF